MPIGIPVGIFHFKGIPVRTISLIFSILLLTFVLVGCTSRTDKGKNKDYDQPRPTAKEES